MGSRRGRRRGGNTKRIVLDQGRQSLFGVHGGWRDVSLCQHQHHGAWRTRWQVSGPTKRNAFFAASFLVLFALMVRLRPERATVRSRRSYEAQPANFRTSGPLAVGLGGRPETARNWPGCLCSARSTSSRHLRRVAEARVGKDTWLGLGWHSCGTRKCLPASRVATRAGPCGLSNGPMTPHDKADSPPRAPALPGRASI